MMTHGQAKEIVAQLTRIANALEKSNSQKDFSKEDAIVIQATEDIQKHLPSEQQPTEKG